MKVLTALRDFAFEFDTMLGHARTGRPVPKQPVNGKKPAMPRKR